MGEMITIAVDAMGGDSAPGVVLDGVRDILALRDDLQVILCGPEDVVAQFCEETPRCEPCFANEVIGMGEHPAQAVRKKKDSSIVKACKLVAEGKADGFFSAGSTGACLTAATLIIGRVRGIQRPMLATIVPTPKKNVLLCDVGANADCKPEYLVQFAQMAVIYGEGILHMKEPKLALLNIGEEESKGNAFAQSAYPLLKESIPQFVGNAEGNDVPAGKFDIVVTDGYTGNVCLKTIEGTAKTIFKSIKGVLVESFATKLAALAIKGGLKKIAKSLSADTFGGAPLIGIKGACVVGHGSTTPLGVANGIKQTADIALLHIDRAIAEKLSEVSADGE